MAGETVRLLCRSVEAAGSKLYLVGGAVRDNLLGKVSRDLDFALSAIEEDLLRSFAKGAGGTFFWLDELRRHARVVVRKHGVVYSYDFTPLQGGSILTDLPRRDFTVNAIACEMSAAGSAIIDPLFGQADLAAGILRACANDTFQADPLRLLRGYRLAATLGFSIDTATREMIQAEAALLARVTPERRRDEFMLLLAEPGVADSLTRLQQAGLLAHLLPPMDDQTVARGASEAAGCEGLQESLAARLPEHAPALLGRLRQETEAGITLLTLLKLALFLRSAQLDVIVPIVAERLRLGNQTRRLLGMLVQQWGEELSQLARSSSPRAVFRFFRDNEAAGPAMIMLELAAGKISAAAGRYLFDYYYGEYQSTSGDLFLTGAEIMQLLGISAGPAVGAAQRLLRRGEQSGEVASKAAAELFLKKNC